MTERERYAWDEYRQGRDRELLECFGVGGAQDMQRALDSQEVIHEGDGTEDDPPVLLGEHVLHMLAYTFSNRRHSAAYERARCLAWVRWGEREHVGAAAVSTGIESGEWPPEEGA